jgi:hypothetical protein
MAPDQARRREPRANELARPGLVTRVKGADRILLRLEINAPRRRLAGIFIRDESGRASQRCEAREMLDRSRRRVTLKRGALAR